MTYKEAALLFTFLTKEDAAEAILATCNYYLTGAETELTGKAAKVFEIEKAAIDRGRTAYKRKRTGGKKGAENRWKKPE